MSKPLPYKQHLYIRCLCALILLCVCFALLSGCSRQIDTPHVTFADDEYAPYADAIRPLLPDYVAKYGLADNVFFHLEQGTVAEAYDAQAASALHAGAAQHWYPQYLSTVIIAVDRDQTSTSIQGWGDLLTVQEPVAFITGDPNEQIVLAAMSYGLEGEGYTLENALNLLATIRKEKRLVANSFEAAIIICLDYQAAAMKKDGRNIEIIVPVEGTFTYEKGLLSAQPLTFATDPTKALLAAGLRLPDGRCDESLYPPAAAYGNAASVGDFAHFNAVCQNISRAFRRDVLAVRLYSAADGREHQIFALIYIILVVLWTASVVHRAVQSGVRRAALCIGGILLLWITARLIKYQLPGPLVLGRYLWYSYYLFQLALPLALLWLAWMVDRPEDSDTFPRWLRRVAIVSGVLLLLVLTNDLHGLVFRLDPLSLYWSSEYEYGIVFYFVMAGYILPLLIAIGLLVVKGRRNPHKRAFVFPLIFCALLLLYGFGYITRVPIAWESDFTITVGLFSLLFMETALRTGMIPVNTKYAMLFKRSSLSMQIIRPGGDVALASASSLPLRTDMLQKVLSSIPAPVEQDENTLLFASPVSGGHALWQEDITALGRLHADIAEAIRGLTAANKVLARQHAIQREQNESAAKTQLMAQLEGEISSYIVRLNDLTNRLAEAPDRKNETARIALLLCYIKRRCNLFFSEKEAERLPTNELAVYFDELGELAALAGVQVHASNTCGAALPVRYATLLYDFLYDVIDWASTSHCAVLLAYMTDEKTSVTLSLLPSADALTYRMNPILCDAVKLAGVALTVKDMDDITGLSLTFAIGGDEHA